MEDEGVAVPAGEVERACRERKREGMARMHACINGQI